MATKRSPIRFAVSPGHFIREELRARGWTQEQLAAKMRRPFQAVNAIINAHKTITADTAIDLGNAFGTSAVYWLNLQSAYQLYRASQKRSPGAKTRKMIARDAPSGEKSKTETNAVALETSALKKHRDTPKSRFPTRAAGVSLKNKVHR